MWLSGLSAGLRTAGAVPKQGAGLGGGSGPWLKAHEVQPVHVSLGRCCFSPSLSPFLPLPLKINKRNLVF